MSTAVYPQGMRAMPASGYNHKSAIFNKQYITWKGTGPFSNPVGSAAGHIRPLTNNDPGNVFPTGFGLPRPIKHFRKGRVIPSEPIRAANLSVKDPHNSNVNLIIDEGALINYNMNRYVASSKGTSLGGGFGGSGLLNEMQDKPGCFIVKENPPNEINGVKQLQNDCKTCEGVGIVSSYYPNNTYLTDNPEPTVENAVLCCNQEYKAKRRAIYASTNLKKNYYTTHTQYLQNRCKTYQQKAFNFLSYKSLDNSVYHSNPYYISVDGNKGTTPGSPLSLTNTYLANCQPNGEIYNASENAIISQILRMMFNQNILTQAEVDNFYTLNINSIRGFFTWINTLSEPQKTLALTVFTDFLKNPYWGMPLAGPSNPTGCQLVVYKPNNYQYAKQGAVDSSTKILKLQVDTISTNAASIQNYNNTGSQLVTANELYAGNPINNIYKNKAPLCNSPTIFQFQNKKSCYYQKLPQYQVPVSKPGTNRYYPRAVTNSNHFCQSPNTYNTQTNSVYK
jgi:hypothetical protein